MLPEGFGWLGDRDEGAVTESDPRLCVCVWGWFLAVCLWTCFGCRCFWCLQMVYLCLGLCVCVYRVMCTYLIFKGFRVVSAFPYVGSHVCVTLCVAHVLVVL